MLSFEITFLNNTFCSRKSHIYTVILYDSKYLFLPVEVFKHVLTCICQFGNFSRVDILLRELCGDVFWIEGSVSVVLLVLCCFADLRVFVFMLVFVCLFVIVLVLMGFTAHQHNTCNMAPKIHSKGVTLKKAENRTNLHLNL